MSTHQAIGDPRIATTSGKSAFERRFGWPPASFERAHERGLVDYGAMRLSMLCAAAGFAEDEIDLAVETFRSVVSPWGEAPLERYAEWPSEISDDNSPIEFSVTIADGRSEVRVLFEPQAEEPRIAQYRAAALSLFDRLEREFGADLGRFRAVSDLFLPQDMRGPFAAWASIVFSPGARPAFKAYFNPQASGAGRSHALVEEALDRLGLQRAWAALCTTGTRRGPHLDEVKYFALDLSADEQARVKVYVRHHSATPEDIEAASRLAAGFVPGEARDFARAMGGGVERLSARATFTCSAFVGGHDARPAAVTQYVPVCAYARDDRAVRRRVTDYLVLQGIDPAAYNGIIHGFADRPLDHGVGMQSWIALRRYRGEPRLTVYLATEAGRVFPPGSVPAATLDRSRFESAEDAVRTAAGYSLAAHPFVQRLARERDASGPLWLLVTNTYEGTSRHFVRWLAMVTARVEDDRMRSLLARQLDQELGEGDIARAHGVLMQDFLRAIEPLRPAPFEESMLASGRRLGERLAKHYLSDDPLEGVASLMAGEICAEQLIGAVGRLLRAQRRDFDPKMMEWLTQHDELEGNHAEESYDLARLVPRDPAKVESVRRGVMGVHGALWASLDELYVSCFGQGMDGGTP